MPEPKPLDQIIDAIAANPEETYDFTKDGKPVAVLVNYDQLQRLKDAAGATDLELALDAVLMRYRIPPYLSVCLDPRPAGHRGGSVLRPADRGDLASDLADVARDYFGRR
jgi:hypothetical protein